MREEGMDIHLETERIKGGGREEEDKEEDE